MEPSLFIGRKVQKHILKSLLSAALGKGASKGKEGAAVTPRLFLFDGENGTGKSSMVNLCLQNVAEIAEESGKPVASMVLDLDAWRYKNGMVPKTPKAMLDTLYAAAAGTFENAGDMLEPFNRLRGKILDVESAQRYYTVIEWPREVFMTGRDSSASGSEAAFQSWLEQKIDPADCALCADPVAPLTAAFTDALVNLSGKLPLVLCIDSLELAEVPELEEWLKKTFLVSLFKAKNNVVCICSGAGSFVRRFRNEFPEEILYPLSLAALPLSRSDIAELCGRKGVTLGQEEVEEIERRTAGIPLAVQALLDHAMSPCAMSCRKRAPRPRTNPTSPDSSVKPLTGSCCAATNQRGFACLLFPCCIVSTKIFSRSSGALPARKSRRRLPQSRTAILR
jgi:hypothetical protein